MHVSDPGLMVQDLTLDSHSLPDVTPEETHIPLSMLPKYSNHPTIAGLAPSLYSRSVAPLQ